MGKYKKKLAWLLMFALCVGMIAFPDSGKVMPVRAAEETTQTEKQVTFDGGVLKIDGVVIVTSEALAGIDLQEYFEDCSWYEGVYTADEWDSYGDSYFFNDVEMANRNLLVKTEKKRR